MTNTIEETTKAMAEQFAKYMPKITTNKNGYEIRTKVLEMAKDQAANFLSNDVIEDVVAVTKED